MRRLFVACVLAALGLGAAIAAALTPPVIPDRADPEDMRLLRQPDIHGDRIVFVYGGNLWIVPAAGGEARRLTSAVGYESLPKFSPDGTQIAFTGEYDGNNDVYVMPGRRRRAGAAHLPPACRTGCSTGSPTAGRSASCRRAGSGAASRSRCGPCRSTGGLETQLPFSEGGLSSWSPDGRKLAFNRQIVENRYWKRYKGGMAQDIWVHDFTDGRTTRLTDWVGADNFPMWSGDTVYFTSDRTGRLQIWAHDLKTRPGAPGHAARGVRRQVAEPRHRRHRLRERRLALGARPGVRTVAPRHRLPARRPHPGPADVPGRERPDRERRPRARREPRRVRRPRRHLHGAGRQGRRAQPHPDPRHPRARRPPGRRTAGGSPT